MRDDVITSLFEVDHETGRMLWCLDYRVYHVLSGVLCGRMEDVYKERLEAARTGDDPYLRYRLSDGNYFFIEPSNDDCRPIFVVAVLSSSAVNQDAGDTSWLQVGWFQKDAGTMPDGENRFALKRLPWSEHAADAFS